LQSITSIYWNFKGLCRSIKLTLILLMRRIWWALNNASKELMGFN
jgi:hypothetical protein